MRSKEKKNNNFSTTREGILEQAIEDFAMLVVRRRATLNESMFFDWVNGFVRGCIDHQQGCLVRPHRVNSSLEYSTYSKVGYLDSYKVLSQV